MRMEIIIRSKKSNYPQILNKKILEKNKIIIYLLIKNQTNIIWLIIELQKRINIKTRDNAKQLDSKLAQLLHLINLHLKILKRH